MTRPALLSYGNAPVGWSMLWSAEDEVRPQQIGPCPFAGGRPAVNFASLPGQGKPLFGHTHPNRQRQAVARCRCDICGRHIRLETKISMSSERLTNVQGIGLVPLVVEPLCCRSCAALSISVCPHLMRQVSTGEVVVRQVMRWRVIAQLLNTDATMEFCGVRRPGVVGHLKMALTGFRIRDVDWLREGA